jgi:hypothetical protein
MIPYPARSESAIDRGASVPTALPYLRLIENYSVVDTPINFTPPPHPASLYTVVHEENSVQGTWARVDVPILTFADNSLGAGSVKFHGGPVASGAPIQLIFWGSWWKTPDGATQATLIIDRTQAVITSNYFSELAQYGVAPPRWRGALTVTDPSPPTTFNNNKDSNVVYDLVDSLIDNDVFPDPDDERIAFVVLMPRGFTTAIARGAHYYDSDYEFPFDTDNFWVAWARYFGSATGEDPEDTIGTLTHELAEMTTDPEPPSGWDEIADPATVANVDQTAWVNGAHVRAYWSNRHSATIIPLDRDYAAQVLATTSEENRRIVDSGTFRPGPDESAMCGELAECCVEDRDYSWEVIGFDEVATVTLKTTRYHTPSATWTVNRKPVSGSGSLQLNVTAGAFVGRDYHESPGSVDLQYTVTGEMLKVHATGLGVNFDVLVECAVTEGAITGNATSNLACSASLRVGFVGASLALDTEYNSARQECLVALTAKYNVQYHERLTPPGEHDPINYATIMGLAAHTRIEQYQAAQQALTLSQMAQAVAPAETAHRFTMSLIEHVPALAAAYTRLNQPG